MNKREKILYYILISTAWGGIVAFSGKIGGQQLYGPEFKFKALGLILGLLSGILIGYHYARLMISSPKKKKWFSYLFWGALFGYIGGCISAFIISFGCGVYYLILNYEPGLLPVFGGMLAILPMVYGGIPGTVVGATLGLFVKLYMKERRDGGRRE
jgi:hypothetical protein